MDPRTTYEGWRGVKTASKNSMHVGAHRAIVDCRLLIACLAKIPDFRRRIVDAQPLTKPTPFRMRTFAQRKHQRQASEGWRKRR